MPGLQAIVTVVLALSLSGCALYSVADAAVTVVATGVKITAKTIGAVADAVIPDGDDDDEDEDDNKKDRRK